MQLTVQRPTPFDQSRHWRLHFAYFEQRGLDAWRSGEIPFYATSNFAVARQHARLLAALVADLEASGALLPTDPVGVLEGGGGSGLFAANLLDALHADPEFAALAPRVVYVLTDYAEINVRQAAATPRLAPWVAAGRVRLARYDLNHPAALDLLDGAPLDLRFALVFTSYVSCVLPMKHLQRRPDGSFHELAVEITADVDDPELTPDDVIADLARDATRHNLHRNLELHFSWLPVDLDALFPTAPHHAAVVRAILAGLDDATVGYPYGYFDFLAGIAPALLPGGAILTVDYGSTRKSRLAGNFERRPQSYGNSIAQDINFTVYDGLAPVLGWDVLRTTEDLASTHASLVSHTPFGPRTRAAFAAGYLGRTASDDLLDYSAVAKICFQRKEYQRALRFYERSVELDPKNLELRYRLGEVAMEAGFPELAVEHLRLGYAMDSERLWDFDFTLGRALVLVGEYAEAIPWYERSLARGEHPVTHTNLGVLFAQAGRLAEAHHAFKRALELDPGHARAAERMAQLKEQIWQAQVAAWSTPAPPAA